MRAVVNPVTKLILKSGQLIIETEEMQLRPNIGQNQMLFAEKPLNSTGLPKKITTVFWFYRTTVALFV